MTILDEAKALANEIIGWRREFHMHPETGMEERETSKRIKAILDSMGVESRITPLGTGVIGTIRGTGKGASEGPCVGLRADIDALPLDELNTFAHKSKIPGVMHACGHDGHAAMLLGAAKLLKKHEHELKGSVRLVFQPGEEGFAGAAKMIDHGCLENPKVDVMIGCHVWNSLKTGTVGVRSGPLMAASDDFKVVFKGCGGHGAAPHRTQDPVVAASSYVMSVQSIISRSVDPLESGVISICVFQSGTKYNVIPGTALLEGTARSYTPEVRELQKRKLEEMARATAQMFGLEVEFKYEYGYPTVVNDPRVTELVRSAAASLLGEDKVVEPRVSMGGEDMAYYLQKVPGMFFFLGSSEGDPEKNSRPNHSGVFDFDEKALPVGVAVLSRFVLDQIS